VTPPSRLSENNEVKLKDRVALVTGGGTGIGRGVSEALAREGATVIVNYSESKHAAEEVAGQIHGIAIKASVSNDQAVRQMLATIQEKFGRLDLLVNNAGWSQRVPHDRLEDLTDEIWDRTLDTNLRGAFYCARAAAPLLKLQAGASIVNIASVAGISGMGSSIVYAASKGAMITMTKSLARALAPEVRVNAVAPGFVRTRFANWPPSAFDEGEAQSPLGQLATTDDIAATVLYFAADALSVTGETIVVDAGTTVLGPRFRKHV
jgi:3-oxoacyl-[acyl-carrier protein] reductase